MRLNIFFFNFHSTYIYVYICIYMYIIYIYIYMMSNIQFKCIETCLIFSALFWFEISLVFQALFYVKVHAPNLIYFYFRDNSINRQHLQSFPSFSIVLPKYGICHTNTDTSYLLRFQGKFKSTETCLIL